MRYSIPILSLLCAFLMPISTFAFEQDGEIFEPKPTIETEDKSIAYNFSGDAEEEGALQLFVKAFETDTDPTAADLNNITPAAGVKLKFEF